MLALPSGPLPVALLPAWAASQRRTPIAFAPQPSFAFRVGQYVRLEMEHFGVFVLGAAKRFDLCEGLVKSRRRENGVNVYIVYTVNVFRGKQSVHEFPFLYTEDQLSRWAETWQRLMNNEGRYAA